MTELVQILQGNTFVVSDRAGDFEASSKDPTGLFSYDTRFLSKWALTVNGQRMKALSVDDLQYFRTRFVIVPNVGSVYDDATMSMIRERSVGFGFNEKLTVMNNSNALAAFDIRIDVESDFADLFEVKDILEKQGKYNTSVEPGRLILAYERETFARQTWISSSEPANIDALGLAFHIEVEAHGMWSTDIEVLPVLSTDERVRHSWDAGSIAKTGDELEQDLEKLFVVAPSLESNDDSLRATYRQSLVDLAALRFSEASMPDRSLPAAGSPWFMTIFGRDSIFTSMQALPFAPDLAKTTLLALAQRQGTRFDDFRDEDPGRIVHEIRFGELTAFEERPHSPYFGNADATSLFVVLLDEYERWSGDVELVKKLERASRACLTWIDEYANLQNNGYVSYKTRNEETGLENQCRKDSWDSISYRNGDLPGFPRATCELQGYAYDAKRRAARLARTIWNDPEFADRLEAEAANLKQRFNRDFWIEDGQYYAIALDSDGRQVDALASNIGHLLWSGIVDDDKVQPIVDHLMSDEMFSGWGVRTLSTTQGRYNPIGYHTGTIWPFDNSFIAWGLRNYGYGTEAARIAAGILDAAEFFNGRLPEAFGGYNRDLTRHPVEYPTACSPQAWSSGTPLLLLRTMLGLEPLGDRLLVDPALPEKFGRVELLDIPGRWGKIDAFGRGRVET